VFGKKPANNAGNGVRKKCAVESVKDSVTNNIS